MLLSIIIPYFQGSEFIRALVDSIERANQDIIQDLEILIIDDGSPFDKTFNLDNCFRTKAFVRIFHKEHGGIADTRNYGLKMCSGMFIAFCDQDDLCISGFSPFLNLVEKYHADLLMSNYASLFPDGHEEISSQISRETVVSGDQCKEMVRRHLGGNTKADTPEFYPSVWNCIFRKQFLTSNEIVLSRFVNFEDDWILILDSLLAADRLLLTNHFWYKHIVRGDSESNTTRCIPDFYYKRQIFRNYLSSITVKAALSYDEKKNTLSFFDARTLLLGFYNYIICPFPHYYRAMRGSPFSILDYKRLRPFVGNQKSRLFALGLCMRVWCGVRVAFMLNQRIARYFAS